MGKKNEEDLETTDNLSEETFSFFEVLNGEAYPKDTVSVYLNEGAAYKIRSARKLLNDIDNEDERQKTIKLIKQYEKEVEASAYTFHITGVDSDLIEAVGKVANKKYRKKIKRPDQSISEYIPEDDQNEYIKFLGNSVLQLHVEKIVEDSTGKEIVAPPLEEIALFLSKAPVSQRDKLSNAIQNLQVSAREFEDRVSDDFLAKP